MAWRCTGRSCRRSSLRRMKRRWHRWDTLAAPLQPPAARGRPAQQGAGSSAWRTHVRAAEGLALVLAGVAVARGCHVDRREDGLERRHAKVCARAARQGRQDRGAVQEARRGSAQRIARRRLAHACLPPAHPPRANHGWQHALTAGAELGEHAGDVGVLARRLPGRALGQIGLGCGRGGRHNQEGRRAAAARAQVSEEQGRAGAEASTHRRRFGTGCRGGWGTLQTRGPRRCTRRIPPAAPRRTQSDDEGGVGGGQRGRLLVSRAPTLVGSAKDRKWSRQALAQARKRRGIGRGGEMQQARSHPPPPSRRTSTAGWRSWRPPGSN